MDKDRNNSCFSSTVFSDDTSNSEQSLQASKSTPLSLKPSLPVTVFPKKQKESVHSWNRDNILGQQKQQLHTVEVQVFVHCISTQRELVVSLFMQVSELLAVHKMSTAEIGTNTGKSLLQPR